LKRGRHSRPAGDYAPEEESELIYGLHPVRELIEQRPESIERLIIARDGSRGMGEILRFANRTGISVSRLPRDVLTRKFGRGVVHQGIAAQISSFPYADGDRICSAAAELPEACLVALDRVVDPRNLGAILRTAAAAGSDGVLLAGEGTAGLSAAVAKTSAGAIERIPVAREPALVRRIEFLQERGFRALVLDAAGDSDWDRLNFDGPLIVVAGGERNGVRRSVAEACDVRVAIPLARGVESLNVAVALGVLLFDVVRRRRPGPGGP
jgi:23S rRNA (guanosine2251-2'-O)-methyltransferase